MNSDLVIRKIKHFSFFVLIFLSPINFSDDSLENQKELISFFDYFEGKDLADTNTRLESKQYTLEKCSALSFVWIGGDNEIFDLGDAFFEEAIVLAGKGKRQVVYDNIQGYGIDYINHWWKYGDPNNGDYTKLMKDDMMVCLEIVEEGDLQKKYEGWKDSKLIED